jgi:integrase
MDELLEQYVALHSMCSEYRKHMARTVRLLVKTGIESPSQFSPQSIARFLESFRGKSSSTIAGYRRVALTLWRYAVEQGLATGPVVARPVRVHMQPVRAWSGSDLSTLVKQAEGTPGEFRSGCPKAAFLKAWILLGFESGLRAGDLHELKVAHFSLDYSVLSTYAHKTGESIDRRLSPYCASAVSDLASLSPDGHLFKWAIGRRWLKRHFSALVRSCHLPGSIKWLRRTGATACEAQSPGSSTAYCGHRTAGLSLRHYVDRSQIKSQPTPPPIYLERTCG